MQKWNNKIKYQSGHPISIPVNKITVTYNQMTINIDTRSEKLRERNIHVRSITY